MRKIIPMFLIAILIAGCGLVHDPHPYADSFYAWEGLSTRRLVAAIGNPYRISRTNTGNAQYSTYYYRCLRQFSHGFKYVICKSYTFKNGKLKTWSEY